MSEKYNETTPSPRIEGRHSVLEAIRARPPIERL